MRLVACLVWLALTAQGPTADPKPAPRFVLPCESYAKGLEKGKGNFGVLVTEKGSPFEGTWHLAEDVWLPAGTEVRAVADGIVRYSDSSPTWTDEHGRIHWNLGNVIVIEHALVPPIDELAAVCSFHVHLAADRRVTKGDRVKQGQVIGRIGKDESEENGRYPAHLHFGLHRGTYFQVPPSFERSIRSKARSARGFQAGATVLRGEVTFKRTSETDVLVRATESGASVLMSLLVGSTAPKDPPADIMCWCQGYGDEETVTEWLRPSTFLAPK
jgi:murein DD-endopeptidase MepM/ murein hydrolase activator NlpD